MRFSVALIWTLCNVCVLIVIVLTDRATRRWVREQMDRRDESMLDVVDDKVERAERHCQRRVTSLRERLTHGPRPN